MRETAASILGIRAFVALVGLAATGAFAQAGETLWPPTLAAEFKRSGLPPQAVGVLVQDLQDGRTVLAVNPARPMNPASLAKLVTTYAALARLGPAWSWRTPLWLTGPVRNGRLEGDLVVRGEGDPSLVVERVWLALLRLRLAGVTTLGGDIVLDRSAFDVPAADPGAFDGEPLRPYNVLPDALLLNHKSVTWQFSPDPEQGVARVSLSPPLAGAQVPATVPLADGPCGDWRAALKAEPQPEVGRLRFGGRFPAACGERSWPMADPWPASFNARMLAGLWQSMGGALVGRVLEGAAPTELAPSFELESPPLAQVVRDINKFSNNTMARQLALTLARVDAPQQPATEEAARAALVRWMQAIGVPQSPPPLLDNGAGLSRHTRLSAEHLAALLRHAWTSPVMPELMASLPVAGADGTLRRVQAGSGRAHLKTGSLRDAYGLAGYVLGPQGRRYLLVAIANDERAGAARPLFDALLQWVADGAPR